MSKFAATFHDPRACRWNCCKTPQGVCATGYTCSHHLTEETRAARRDAEREAAQVAAREAERLYRAARRG